MNKKMLFKVIPVIFVFCVILTNVSGFGNGFNSNVIPSGLPVQEIKSPIQRIWGTLSLILKMCAVGGIILTGIRYMFVSSDVKADMKKTLPYLITGIVIVFAGTYIIDFVVEIFKNTTGT